MNGHVIVIVVIVVLFFVSALMALAETAFVRVSRIRIMNLADEGDKRADRLLRLLERPEATLNSVLLVLLACQMVSATLLGTLLEPTFGTIGVAVGMVIEITVVFTFAEVAPKTFAVQHTERAAMAVSGVLVFVTRFWLTRILTRGFIGLANIVLPGKGLRGGPFVTEAEILTMADVAAQEASIETEERELIHSIFEFGDTVVREVMAPRPDMVSVAADVTVDEAIRVAIAAGRSRLPAYDVTTDDIIGLVFLKDLVTRSGSGEGNEPVRQMLRPAHFVPESKRVAELLREMQTEKFHMAMVIDEHGGTAGVVTMEDLLEEIVGEITDEYDVDEPQVERLPGGALRVPGRTPIDEVNDLLDAELPQEEWDTVGGLVLDALGHVPVEGESARVDGLEFCAERVQGRRVVLVRISRTGRGHGVSAPETAAGDGVFRSGFVSVVGRPNVGKSTLVNQLVGQKVSIVSDRPQTTRTQVRGVRTNAATQIVFLDTPGIHKPRTLLGERTNSRAVTTLGEVDVICFVIDASEPVGRGDRFIARLAEQVATPVVLVVNKTDRSGPQKIAEHLAIASGELGEPDAFVPVSALTGDGVEVLASVLETRMPTGPHYYPDGVVSDQPESILAAEILREKLIAGMRDELPHSIAVTTEEREERETKDGPLLALRLVIRVERASQRGIVIGRGASLLRQAGTEARLELEALLGVRVHLETHVRVDRDWQRRAASLDRLGL